MNFYEKWIELDLNPIISFSSSGKILFFNTEAQFLLDRVNHHKLFDLTLKYAPKNFGVKTSYIALNLKNYTFYAITVMYENENEIHLKLYKSSSVKKENPFNIKNINTTNIFTLIDLAISSSKIKTNTKYIKNYDPSIPEFKLDANTFMKTLNQIFELTKNSSKITCSVMLKIGEYIKIKDKKYPLVSVEIKSDKRIDLLDYQIKEEDCIILNFKDDKVCIDLPLIT